MRRARPLRVILTWLSGVLMVGVTAAGWWTGRPLSPEMMVTLGAFWSWAAKMDLEWGRQARDRRTAIKSVADKRGISPARAEVVYALVEAEVEREQRELARRPPGRNRS